MADAACDPPPDPDDMLDLLQVPSEVVEKSNLADRRPDVNRLRAVRTGEGTATLYVGWPENTDTLALPARVYEQARVSLRRPGGTVGCLHLPFVRTAGETPTAAYSMRVRFPPMASWTSSRREMYPEAAIQFPACT
jgi:hypothetical protein